MTNQPMRPPAGDSPGMTIKTIPVEAIRDGMIPAEDVTDNRNRLLCKAGTPLHSRDARLFKTRGVGEVRVQCPGEAAGPSPGEPLPDPEAEEILRTALDELFRFAGVEHEAMKELYRCCRVYYSGAPDRPRKLRQSIRPLHAPAPDELLRHIPPFPDEGEVLKKAKQPSLPEVVIRLNEAIDSPRGTAAHIADIISKDAALTARLLRLVNSPIYNFPSGINSIPRAVTIVGSRQLSMMAVGTVVASTFHHIPSRLITMESFWKHSIACGVAARSLAGQKQNPHPETWFLAGLLHDIGRLVIYQDFPDHARLILQQAISRPGLSHLLEQELLGITHARLGGALLQYWKLSPALQHACLRHHDPAAAEDPVLAAAVHIADIIANAMRWGNSGEWFVPPLNPEAWNTLGLPVSAISAAISQTQHLLQDILGFYMPASSPEPNAKRSH